MLDKDGIKKTTTISALIMFLIASASCNYFKGYPVCVRIFFSPGKPSLRFKNDLHSVGQNCTIRRELIVEKVDILANDPALNDRHSGMEALNCVIES